MDPCYVAGLKRNAPGELSPVDLALDVIERLPTPVLLGVSGAAFVGALLVAAAAGGSIAVWALALGALTVAVCGGLLAVKVHLRRMPLELGDVGVRDRLDGHVAVRFRSRLGRGRRMDRARATVRFVPEQGEPIELQPLMAEAAGLVGPWTVVVVDRHDQCDQPGAFEVRVQAREGSKTWAVEARYSPEQIHEGRFVSSIRPKALTLQSVEPWDAVRAPTERDVG